MALEHSQQTGLLEKRTRRTNDYVRENVAMHQLATMLCGDPEDLLARLLDFARELCGADSAGVSRLEGPRGSDSLFRWIAASGNLAAMKGYATPFDCPSGVTLSTQQPQLFCMPHTYFKGLRSHSAPPLVEVLLVPWSVPGLAEGTLAVATHNTDHHFDSEDVRVLKALATYVSSAIRQQDTVRAFENLPHSEAALNIARELAHHVNNPLQSATLAMEVLGDPKRDDEMRQRAFVVAQQQLQRIADVVSEILEHHRMPTPSDHHLLELEN